MSALASENEEPQAARPGAQTEKEKAALRIVSKPGPENGQASLLEAALVYAGIGWPVFPCHPLDEPEGDFQARKQANPKAKRFRAKAPLIAGGCHSATSSRQQIRAWWGSWPDAMIGLATGKVSGILALDVDLPDGEATLKALEVANSPLPKTVEQRTGSGGRHLFFKYPNDGKVYSVSAGGLGPGLDTRGTGGHVILPPSGHPSGGSYEWVNLPGEVEIADAPAWLLDMVAVRPGQEKTDTKKPVIESDQNHHVLEAIHWLQDHAPEAVEGQGGDSQTFQVAATLRDIGISEELALELLLAHWNERCSPPWEVDDLRVKVRNAFAYASRYAPGGATAEAAFDGQFAPEMPNDRRATSPGREAWSSINLLDYRVGRYLKKAPPPGDYAFGSLRIGTVGIIVGPPGTGKTHLGQHIGASVAVGDSAYMGDLFPVSRKGRVVIFSAEDDEWAVHDRMWRQFGDVFEAFPVGDVTKEQVRLDRVRRDLEENLIVFPAAGRDLRLTVKDGSGYRVHDDNYNGIWKLLKHIPDLRLVLFDPMIQFTGGDENDNAFGDFFINRLVALAQQLNVSVLLSHHVVKGYAGRSKNAFDLNVALGQEAARGASAFIGAVSWMFNLVPLPVEAAMKEAGLAAAFEGEYLAGRVSKNRYGMKSDKAFFHVDGSGLLHVIQPRDVVMTKPLAALEDRVFAEIERQEHDCEQLMAKTAFAEHYARVWRDDGATVRDLKGVIASMLSRGILFEVTRRYSHRSLTYLATCPDDLKPDKPKPDNA